MLKNKIFFKSHIWPPFLVYLLVIGIEAILFEAVFLYLKYQSGIYLKDLLEIMQTYIGPVVICYLFLFFIILLVFSTLLLAMDFLDIHRTNVELHLSLLNYFQAASPLLGILVTFWSLMQIQLNLDLTLPQNELFSQMAVNNGKAFGSTIVGIVLAFLALSIRTTYNLLAHDKEPTHAM